MAQYRNAKEFTDKIRNEYGKAREIYTALNDKLDKVNMDWQRDLQRGWSDMHLKNEDTIKYENTKKVLKQQIQSIIDETNAKFEEIRAEADTIFGVYNRATGDKLDIATLELLKSGILSNEELKALATDFDGNITMLRLIGKYAEERAKKGDTVDREMGRLSVICKTAEIPYREPIENLIFLSQQGLREDRIKSDGIAKIYDEQADKITAQAEGVYIKVSE